MLVPPVAEIQWWFHLVLDFYQAAHDTYGDISIIKIYGTICRRAGTCRALSESVHRAPGTLSSQPGFNKIGTKLWCGRSLRCSWTKSTILFGLVVHVIHPPVSTKCLLERHSERKGAG
jgi:hypothetical protein